MKRSASLVIADENEESNRSIKRHKEDGESTKDTQGFSLDEFPEDILAHLAIQFLDDYPLRSKVKNPLGYINALSKRWNGIIGEPYFVSRLRSTPNAALHLLQADEFNNVGIERNWDLLKVAAPIFNMEERLSAIMSSSDMAALRLLADLPNYELIRASDYYRTSDVLFRLMAIYHPGLDEEQDMFYEDRTQFPVMDKMFIFDVPPEIMVKYLIIEDLHNPYRYTWIFNAIMVSVCHVYFYDRRHLPQLVQWFKTLSGIPFPFTQFDMTCELLTWPILLALLVKDWEFIDLLCIDYDRVMKSNKERHANYISRSLLKCREKKCCQIPAKAMSSLEFVCSIIGTFDFMGFDSEVLKEKFRALLPDFRDQKSIRKIRNLIMRD